MSVAILPVLLPLPFDRPFDYRAEQKLPAGTMVRVPFGPRELVGVVWGERSGEPVPESRLKAVKGVVDLPALSVAHLAFLRAAAERTLAPLGALLRLTLAVPAALEPVPVPMGLTRGEQPSRKLTTVEARVLAALSRDAVLASAELAKLARTSTATLRRMEGQGLLSAAPLPAPAGGAVPDPDHPGVELTPAQLEAASRLQALVRGRGGTALLDGVPGSGKTEVYLEAVAEARRLGRSVLVLLPEIALGAQWLERFERRFGVLPVSWHSGLTAAQRRKGWREIAVGRAPVVVGARSALFLPLHDLGLVIVDEEHDSSFKQEDGTSYHARDLALERARLEGAAVVLASATPSLETALAAGAVPGAGRAQAGWQRCHLPSRHGAAGMPTVEILDLRRDRPVRGTSLAPGLRQALVSTFEEGGQSLLFLNRRGFAPLTLCRACGHRLRCPNCTAWLTAHRLKRRLQCHHCGWSMPAPEHCPECGAVETLVATGPGVERVAEEVQALLPSARLAVMTSDTVHTAGQAARLVTAMAGREVDILLGTQMIAKGHHFPELTLVGVVDADLTLGGGDPRAAEKTFQLLYQVAGRSGRGERPGRVLLQTHMPDHPVIQAIARGDRDRFLEVEHEEREAFGLPPCGRLAAVIVQGPDAQAVSATARELARRAPEAEGPSVLGPAPAPLALLRGRWRERLLVKCAADFPLGPWMRAWLASLTPPRGVVVQADMDPVSFM